MRKRSKIKLKKKNQKQIKNSKYLTFKRSWTKKSFKYSFYPYLLIISFFRRNVFLTATNHLGQTKCWTSSGRAGFKGRVKIEHMALVTTANNFFQKIWNQGIRHMLLIFKNYNPRHKAIIRAIKLSLEKKMQMNFIGFIIKTQTVFNGCRRKKFRHK